jgi:hypothetical protein
MNIQKQNIFISWQSQETRNWYVVGNLEYDGQTYNFRYTNGSKKAKKDGFTAFQGMSELDIIHSSTELFPLFRNRVLSSRRPEYPRFISWLRLGDDATEMDLLERSNGIKVTDNLQTFSRLEIDDSGSFDCFFFLHGLSHRTQDAKDFVSKLTLGDQLFLKRELNNSHDSNATMVLSSGEKNSALQLGYCPGYLSSDVSKLLNDNYDSIKFTVESFDSNAPVHYQLMCRLTGQVTQKFDRSQLDEDEFKFVQG